MEWKWRRNKEETKWSGSGSKEDIKRKWSGSGAEEEIKRKWSENGVNVERNWW